MQKTKAYLRAYGPIIGLSVLIWVVFGQAIHFDFVYWDDNLSIYNNPNLQAPLWQWPKIFWIFNFETSLRFEPVAWLGHMVICSIFTMNAGAYHFCLIVLHFINSLLVYKLSLRILSQFPGNGAPREAIAFTASAFWAINALRAEPVGWCTGLAYPLATLFVLSSFRYYLISVQEGRLQLRFYFLSLALNGLAACTFPISLGYAFCLPFFDQIFFRTEIPRRWNWRSPDFGMYWVSRMLFVLPSIAIGLATVYIRRHPFGLYASTTMPVHSSGILRLIHGTYAWTYIYLRQFWPFGTTPGNFPWRNPGFHWIYLSALLCLAGAFTAVWRKRSTVMLAILVISMCLAGPMLGLSEDPSTPADRYTYLPNAFFTLLLVWAVSRFWPQRPASIGAAIMFCIGAALLTILSLQSRHQLRIWSNSYTLFAYLEATQEVKSEPGRQDFINGKKAYQLAIDGHLSAALSIYDDLVRREPGKYGYWYTRSQVLYLLGRRSEALKSAAIAHALFQNQKSAGTDSDNQK